MELKLKKSIELVGLFTSTLVLVILITEISGFSLDDYEQQQQQQGLREILEEIERQGGLTAPIVPRSQIPPGAPGSVGPAVPGGGYYSYFYPNHKMARKSQRSNTLRLRFGKRSLETAPEGPIGYTPGSGWN